jgi:hypothetical protein
VTSLHPQLLPYLMEFIKYQDQVIRTLLTLFIGKSMFEKPEGGLNRIIDFANKHSPHYLFVG